MDNENLQTLREVTASVKFKALRRTLKRQLIMTDALKSIITETRNIQSQIAELRNPDKPWGPGNRAKVDGLLIIGNSGTGKTQSIETAVDLLKAVDMPGRESVEPKAMIVPVPSSGTAAALAKDIIVRCGLKITRDPKPGEAADKVVGNLARYEPTLVLIDEASRCASPAIHTPAAIRKESGLMWTVAISALDATIWPTPLIITGLPCLLESLYLPDSDDRIRKARGEASRRFRKIRIPDATIDVDGPVIEGVIDQYCMQLGLASLLTEHDEIGARLIHASNYAFGTALVIAQHAVALAACRDGKKGKLQRSDFSAIYHIFAGGSMTANIFEVSDWARVDPEVLMPETYDDAIYKDLGDAA